PSPTINATANSARADDVCRQRYCRIKTPAAATSSKASRIRDGTQAKPVSAAGFVAPISPGTIREAITSAKTLSAATIVSVVLAVSAATASTGNVSVSRTHTAQPI